MAEIDLSLILRELNKDVPAAEVSFDADPELRISPYRTENGKIGGAPYYGFNGSPRGAVEYYLPVTITYGNKTIDLPFPILSFSGKKRVVETPLTERTGSVMELINTDSYEISVRGFMINTQGEYPEDDLIMLTQLYSNKTPVEINNVVTDVLLTTPTGKNTVVITSFKVKERPGVKHVREYELSMSSNEDFNLVDITAPNNSSIANV